MAVLWFGTRGFETWVKAPLAGGDHSRVGYAGGTLQYLNGGAGLVASQSAHREYSWSWGNGTKRDDLRPIIDFAEGVYDSQDGTNLIYFIDPMTMDRNVLPQNWATPSLGTNDGMPLMLDADPAVVATPANTLRYPARGARYDDSGINPASLYIPAPPGYALWVGVHGEVTGDAAVVASTYNGFNLSAQTRLEMIDLSSSLRCNTYFNRPAPSAPNLAGYGDGQYGEGVYGGDETVYDGDFTGIELTLDIPSGSSITIYGMIAQVLKIGQSPTRGNFISGQGHSGCQFAQHPTESPYSSLGEGRVGATAKLVETGSWING